MMWALSSFVSIAVTLGLQQVLSRWPPKGNTGARADRHGPTGPYRAGALSVMTGTLAGGALVPEVALRTAVPVAVSILVGVRVLRPRTGKLSRNALNGLCWFSAILAVAAGARLDATGTGVADGATALVWIVLVSSAWRFVGSPGDDALPAAMSLVAAAAVATLAVLGSQEGIAAVAAALSGSCLAFLTWRAGPGAPALGHSGRLFLGLMVAVLTLEARTVVWSLGRLLVPLLLVAVPLCALAIDSFGRLRRGLSLGRRSGGHLPRRLTLSGLPTFDVMATLLGAQAFLAVAAVVAGRGGLPLGWAAAIALFTIGGLTILALRVPAYREPVVGLPRPARLGVSLAVLAPFALVLPPLAVLGSVRSSIDEGTRAALRAVEAGARGDPDDVDAGFDQAARAFERAGRRLQSPFAAVGLGVPVLSPSLRAARTLVDGGEELVRTGQGLSGVAREPGLRVVNATVQLEALRRLEPELAQAAADLRRVNTKVGAVDRRELVGTVRKVVDRYEVRVRSALEQAETAHQAARVAPAVLGSEGSRRYLLVVQNNAEARATGGLIGNFGELVLEDGEMRLERFGRLRELITGGSTNRVLRAPPEYLERYGRFDPAVALQNVNMSPDFPTVAAVLTDLYPQAGGRRVDGVIGVDPLGLAALLSLVGPVRVPQWPEPIGPTNVVDVTLRSAYAVFPKGERIDFLGDVTHEVVRRMTVADLGEPAEMASAFSSASRGRHLMIYLTRPHEQKAISDLGLAGAVSRPRSDELLLVTQNAGANKLDYYLRRQLRYEVRLRPEGNRAAVEGRLQVVLHNTAPSVGLDREVLGPNRPEFAPGENYSYISVYMPPGLVATRVEGDLVDPEASSEFRRPVYSGFVSIPAGSTRTVTVDLRGSVPLPDGRYELQLFRQPLVNADEVKVVVEVSHDWRVVEPVGLQPMGEQRAETSLELDSDRTLGFRVEQVP